MKIFKCELCDFCTENGKVMSNHKRWKHITPKGSEKYDATVQKLSKERRERIRFQQICPECKKAFEVIATKTQIENNKYRHYCSKFCANKQGSKYVDYSKVSIWQKEHPTGCFSTEWKLAHPDSNVSKKNHSKRELEIVSYFKSKFPDDEWKQGLIDGDHRHNGILLCPDLWSKKIGVVIEYDGIWHFEDIHNQLEHKQKTDKELMQFCRDNNLRIIRIDEELKLTNEQIENAIYNSNKMVEIFDSSRYSYLLGYI